MKSHRRLSVSVADYRSRARTYLPRAIFDYLEGGAEDERCLQRNRDAWNEILFRPKAFQDVSKCDLSVTLFGRKIAAPMILGPTGCNGLFRTNGDILLARAAARANLPFVLSTPASSSIEEVAQVAGDNLWFQLYVINWELANKLLYRARDAGCGVLIVTIDAVRGGKRERDLHNEFSAPWSNSAVSWLDSLLHPVWAKEFRAKGPPRFANLNEGENPSTVSSLSLRQMDPQFTWSDLKRLREKWPRHFVVKGLLNPSDIEICLQLGVDAVVLSNHGGRQLDSVPSAIEVLPHVRPHHKDATLLLDGGIRRGQDVVKAMALGAQAVLLGRASLYGLAADGEQGVYHVIEILKEEMARTLTLLGCQDFSSLDESYLFPRDTIASQK